MSVARGLPRRTDRRVRRHGRRRPARRCPSSEHPLCDDSVAGSIRELLKQRDEVPDLVRWDVHVPATAVRVGDAQRGSAVEALFCPVVQGATDDQSPERAR